ncbi:His/Gly/Thr/Pro-type tRNA ligase C-terminal domain-containing protein, partial [Patescibacteria group bacterium]|nr:His/Gly/Thr/Pro-type tRNA ligase C-terminal domain-containing protein [Patescibacteria group bacterium]
IAFSKYSHEFQALTPAGEDAIHICKKCSLAINEEIFKEYPACPSCGGNDFKEEKAIEVGNIFKLSTRYSKPFELIYKDEKGKEKEVIMGCYGIGLNRLMGTIVEVFHDERGIIWPEEVAPFKAHLIEIDVSAEKIYEKLNKAGVEVLYDDRKISAGQKFAEADLIGLPWRLVVSKKTGDKIEIKNRSKNKADLINISELIKLLSK